MRQRQYLSLGGKVLDLLAGREGEEPNLEQKA